MCPSLSGHSMTSAASCGISISGESMPMSRMRPSSCRVTDHACSGLLMIRPTVYPHAVSSAVIAAAISTMRSVFRAPRFFFSPEM